MDTTKFKYVVGEAKTNEVCDIRFFDAVNGYSANAFNSRVLMDRELHKTKQDQDPH